MLTALEGGKYDEAKAGLDKIAAQGPSGYRALAQMTAAGAQASKDPQGAIGAFDAVASSFGGARFSFTWPVAGAWPSSELPRDEAVPAAEPEDLP